MVVDRFRLAAIVDRLIYESEDTFDRDDALTLYAMIPAAAFRRRRFRDWLQISSKLSISGGSASGVAAGIGKVQVPTDEKSFEFDSAGRAVLRAGQWKIVPGRDSITIEQVMATDLDEGKSALIRYRRGEPLEMDILVARELKIVFFRIEYGSYMPWKTVRSTADDPTGV